MLRVIIKELKEIFREGRFRVLAIIVTLLLIASSWVSYHHQEQLRQLHVQAQAIERQVWETQKSKNPHSAAHFGQYVFKPVFPLSIIDPGIDRYIGVMQYLEAHKRNHEQFSALQDQTELARFADLTPAFVLLFLVPLIIIVIGYGTVTAERESGTLKLLVTQGAPVSTILVGKWLAILASLAAFILPVLLVTGVILSGSDNFYWSVFFCFIATYLVYYAVVAGITVIISSLSKSSGIAFLSALMFWIVTTILIPKTASNVANGKAPLLSNEEIVQWVNNMNKSRGGNVHDLNGEVYKHLVDSMLQLYKVDSVSKLPVNMAGIRLDFGEQQDTRNFKIVYDSMFHQVDRQQRLLSYGSILSPYLLTQDISMHLAQTDNENHRHFSDAGEAYRRVLVNKMNRFIAYDSKRQESFTQFDAPEELWRSVPEFVYKPLTGEDALRFSTRSITILTAWLLITATVLIITSNRLKP